MKNSTSNQFTGYHAPDYRFRFHNRSISHRALFLPIGMKKHPKIIRLIKGESPLSVFNCQSIHEARQAFNQLRKRFDFAYWAISDYRIRHIDDADSIVPLCLNRYQHYIIDIMQKRHSLRKTSRYVITKSFPQCGLTTCVQAYIIWLQYFHCANNSCTYSSGDVTLNPLKANLLRHFGKDTVSTAKKIPLRGLDWSAHFNSFRSPDAGRGINFGYIHFADMSKWKDPDGQLSARAARAAVSGVLMEYFTLVVFEGNIPPADRFPFQSYRDLDLEYNTKIHLFSPLARNPYFLAHTVLAASQPADSHLIHLHLDPSLVDSQT